MCDIHIKRILIKHGHCWALNLIQRKIYQRQVDMYIIKFLLLIVVYHLLIFLNGSRSVDFWLRLNLAGNWKLRESREYVTLQNFELYSILHHVYEVLHGKIF